MNKETEQLLVALGQRISGYQYLGSEPIFEVLPGTETVKIGGKTVPLNRKLLNYKKIENYLFGYGNNGLVKCISQLQSKKANHNRMVDLACGYLGDVLKYANVMIPDSIELIEALVIRTSNNINAKSVPLFQQYHVDIEQGERYVQTTLSERQAKTLYDAEHNKMISATIYPHRNFLGVETGMISVSSRSLVNVDVEMQAHKESAMIMSSVNKSSAKKVLSEKLCDMIADELTTFAAQFEDILVVKRGEFFDKINYRSNDISICPYKYYSYLKNERFHKEDFPNIKKMIEYYDLSNDFIDDLENVIYLKIYESILDNKEIRASKNHDLYFYLTGKKNLADIPTINRRIYHDCTDELESFLDDDHYVNEYDIDKAKEIMSSVNKNRILFSNTQYKTISDMVKEVSLKKKRQQQEDRAPKRKKRILYLVLFIACVIFWVIQYQIIQDAHLLGQQLGGFLGILLVIALIRGVIKLFKKWRGY